MWYIFCCTFFVRWAVFNKTYQILFEFHNIKYGSYWIDKIKIKFHRLFLGRLPILITVQLIKISPVLSEMKSVDQKPDRYDLYYYLFSSYNLPNAIDSHFLKSAFQCQTDNSYDCSHFWTHYSGEHTRRKWFLHLKCEFYGNHIYKIRNSAMVCCFIVTFSRQLMLNSSAMNNLLISDMRQSFVSSSICLMGDVTLGIYITGTNIALFQTHAVANRSSTAIMAKHSAYLPPAGETFSLPPPCEWLMDRSTRWNPAHICFFIIHCSPSLLYLESNLK